MGEENTPKQPPEIDETLPEVVKKFLRLGYQLEDIFLDARGDWYHQGEPFENERLIALFSRSVGRTKGGTWILEVPPFTYPIRVEDVGFFVEKLVFLDDTDALPELKLSDGSSETLELKTLSYRPEGRLYCRIKNGAFRARFKQRAYNQLSEYFVERDDGIWVEFAGQRQKLL